MRRAATIISSLVAFGALGACSTAPVASTGSRRIHTADEASIQGSYVPAGTRFEARLDHGIDTQANHGGDPFTATVVSALSDREGHVIVPAGARIAGRVHSVQGASGSRIRLDFDSIDTVKGRAQLEARIENADSRSYRGPRRYSLQPFGYDSWYGSYYGSYPMPYGGGPSGYIYDTYRPREVQMPSGATISLELTHPLLAPGAAVVR